MENQWLFFSTLKNTTVRDANQEKSGSFEDAVLDLHSGQVALFISGSGGFLGLGESKSAIPGDALFFANNEARLSVAEERMHASPGTTTELPQHIDSDFIDEVYRHYGYQAFTGR